MTGESTERRDESHVVRHFRNHGLKLCMPLGISKIRSWWIQWSKEERQQKFAQRNLNFGNTYSVGMNFYVGGEVGNDPWLLRAYRERRLYEPGYEPQGREREWPYMMDITSYHTRKDFHQIQQENSNRGKDDDHNDDNNSDKSSNNAWRNWGSTAKVEDKKDGGSQANHDWSWVKVLDKKDDVGWKKSNQSWTTEERSKQEWSKPSSAKKDWSHYSVWETPARNKWPPIEPEDSWRDNNWPPLHP